MSSRQPQFVEQALLKLYQYINSNEITIEGLFSDKSLKPAIEVILELVKIEDSTLSSNTGLSSATIRTLIHQIQDFNRINNRKNKLESTGNPIEELYASSSAASSSQSPQQRLTNEITQLEQQLAKLTDAHEKDLQPVLTAISAYNCYNQNSDEINKLTDLIKERDKQRSSLEQVFQKLDNALWLYHEVTKNDDEQSAKLAYLEVIAKMLSIESIQFDEINQAIINYIDKNIPQELKNDVKSLLNKIGNEEELSAAHTNFKEKIKASYFNKSFNVPLRDGRKRLQAAHDYHGATQQSHRHIAQIVASWYANKLNDLLLPLIEKVSHLTDEQKLTYQKLLKSSCGIAHPNPLFASVLKELFPPRVKAQTRKQPNVKKGRRRNRSSSTKSQSNASSSSPATIIDLPKAQGLNDPLHFIKMYRLALQWFNNSKSNLIPTDSELSRQLDTFSHNRLTYAGHQHSAPSHWQSKEFTDSFILAQKQRSEINEQLSQKKLQLQRVKEELKKQQQEKLQRQLTEVNQDYENSRKKKAVLECVSQLKLDNIIIDLIQSRNTEKLKSLILIHNFKLSNLSAKTNHYFRETNNQLVTIILDNIPINKLTEQHSNLLVELFREGFIANNHITQFNHFYRNLLLSFINTGDNEKAKRLYKFIKPILQNHIIDVETSDTLLHLAIKLKNLELLIFSLKQGCNYRQRNSQGESPLTGLANLECSENEYAALIAQLPRNIFTCNDISDRSLYQLASGTNKQIIFDHIIATSINLITSESQTQENDAQALELLQHNQLSLTDISLETIKAMTSTSLEKKYRLLRYQTQQRDSIYTLTKPNEALKEFIIETIIECLSYEPSLTTQAQILMLTNHLSSEDLIAYFKNHPTLIAKLNSNNDSNNEAKSLKTFISQIQNENLQKCPTLATMKQFIQDYTASDQRRVDNKILTVLQHHFAGFFQPIELLDDVELVDLTTVKRLYRWLNLAFDIKHGFIQVDGNTELTSLYRYRPVNFLYQTYEDYFTGDFDPDALFEHISDDEIKQKLIDLIATSNRIRNKYPQDSQQIKHAVINFALLAKHYESDRTHEVFNNPMYRVINHRRAQNLIHRLFIWLSNLFIKRDTTSHKAVSQLSHQYSQHGYCSTLFKPQDCSVLYRLSRESSLQDIHRGCYILINNKGLCYYPQHGELEIIQSVNQLQQNTNLRRFLSDKLKHDNQVNIPSSEIKQQLVSYTNYREGISVYNILALPASA